jgi:hypothetical protein
MMPSKVVCVVGAGVSVLASAGELHWEGQRDGSWSRTAVVLYDPTSSAIPY